MKITGEKNLKINSEDFNLKLFINIFSNLLGKIWSFTSIYLFVPKYISFLGVEAYGVVAFYSAFISILVLADAGFSAAFLREVARKRNDLVYIRSILYALEPFYFLIGLLVFSLTFLLSGWIASDWLSTGSSTPSEDVRFSIIIMGGVAAFQLFSSLYNAGLMGAERHALANSNQVVFSTIRSGIVLLPLYFFHDLKVFFVWQLFSTLFYFLYLRQLVWKLFGGKCGGKREFKILKPMSGYAIGIASVAIIAALNTNLDKLIVSKLLPLSIFSKYSTLSLISQVPAIICLPIAIALLPRFTKWVEEDNYELIKKTYFIFSYLIAIISCSVAFSIAVDPSYLIKLWTGNENLAQNINFPVYVLLLGSVFLALQYMPYHLAIANGHNRTNIVLGFFCLLFTPGLTAFLIIKYGLSGATISWLLVNGVSCFILGFVYTKKFMKINPLKWFCLCLILPVVIIVISGTLAKNSFTSLPEIIHMGVIGFMCLIAGLLFYPLLIKLI
ncbi:polysaccharide biosynthesis C-terminal domain-containing protein [Chromobacterium violaceum]|uniref:polysaccharide biosynthesis C-terminal domain-containing protein n=1 Tax=Chromobacterium violaceum TaxID=536 RepID=UPI001BEAD035|nr:polysaccharide biosynthesis C-terminal domain-containing protein [Chromobacterium violaceum]MBT2869261.1 polysaccharide biosynthesis C-terminal domain-containing protein [Chromobacterium violaceum]